VAAASAAGFDPDRMNGADRAFKRSVGTAIRPVSGRPIALRVAKRRFELNRIAFVSLGSDC